MDTRTFPFPCLVGDRLLSFRLYGFPRNIYERTALTQEGIHNPTYGGNLTVSNRSLVFVSGIDLHAKQKEWISQDNQFPFFRGIQHGKGFINNHSVDYNPILEMNVLLEDWSVASVFL